MNEMVKIVRREPQGKHALCKISTIYMLVVVMGIVLWILIKLRDSFTINYIKCGDPFNLNKLKLIRLTNVWNNKLIYKRFSCSKSCSREEIPREANQSKVPRKKKKDWSTVDSPKHIPLTIRLYLMTHLPKDWPICPLFSLHLWSKYNVPFYSPNFFFFLLIFHIYIYFKNIHKLRFNVHHL